MNSTLYEPIRARARGLAAILFIGALGTILYWLTFFTSGAVQASADACYLVFERSFPAADGWTAAASLAAARSLWRARPSAVLWGIAAGSGFVFLGLMDVLYNIENGMYALANPEMGAEIVINAFCLAIGPATIAWVWRSRRVLDPR